MIFQCKIATYFNAEAQGRVTAAQAGLAICSEPSRAKRVPRVRRESWSSELELESEVVGESEDQRPESRLAHESMFAGPA